MNRDDIAEDVPFFLYLVPIVASIAYGVVAWFIFGTSFSSRSMPLDAYITVSKSPYLFLGSVGSVLLAIYVEIRYSPTDKSFKVISDNSRRLEWLALICLVISFVAAVSASGYSSDPADAVKVFLQGRYALIFALFAVVIAFVIAPATSMQLKTFFKPTELTGLGILVISPFAYFLGFRLGYGIPAGIGAIVLLGVGTSILYVSLKPKQMGTDKSPKTNTVPP